MTHFIQQHPAAFLFAVAFVWLAGMSILGIN